MTVPAPVFSVVVLNWNGKRFLQSCLGSLAVQTFSDFEVILVDNGSSDGSAEFVRQAFPHVKLVCLPFNQGFCRGNNQGIRQATGRWIMLLNNDTEVDSRGLEVVHEASGRHPEVAMFAPKMIFYHARERIDNCGMMVALGGTAWEIGRNERDGTPFNRELWPFGPSGGAAFYRRDLLEDVGLLDEDFFMSYEDLDLAFRARLRGHTCQFVPGAVVYHHHSATSKANPGRRVYLSQRNIEYTYVKNMPSGLIVRYGFYHLIYNIGGLVYFTRTGNLRPYLKAKGDALKALPALLQKRKAIQSTRVLSTKQVKQLLVTNWFRFGMRKALGMKKLKWPAASLESPKS